MGYQTHYTLATDDGREDEHREAIGELSEYRKSLWQEGVKWYGHQKDMAAYSKENPGVLFILDGDGEEAGDVWRKWFKNGKSVEWSADVTRPEMPPLGIDALENKP